MISLLRGAYDLHVHCAPDVVPRAQDVFDLARQANQFSMAGVGLKDHTCSTVGRCYVLNRLYPEGPQFVSSIVLNPPVGGLNPAATEAALASGVDIVYLPTYSARHHIECLGESFTPVPHPADGVRRLSVLDREGQLVSEVVSILQQIASHDAALATGHVSPREALAVLSEARRCGVRRTVVTHASLSVPDMSIDDQRRAIDSGALVEHCFHASTECCPGRIPIESMIDQIRAVGPEHVMLSSDFGQVQNGPPLEAFASHLHRMIEFGFSEDEIRLMCCENPKRLLRQSP